MPTINELHLLFTTLTLELNTVPTNAFVASAGQDAQTRASFVDLRDDSMALLHAMDRVFGCSNDSFTSGDSSANSSDDETKVYLGI